MSALKWADFFGYRTALLSRARFDEIDRRLFTSDGELCDGPLLWVIDDCDLGEALLAASSNLYRKIAKSDSLNPEIKSIKHADRSLNSAVWRYMRRMSGRATPFGLFAAMGVGEPAEQTALPSADTIRINRHVRLDMEALWTLSRRFAATSSKSKFRVNESLVIKQDHFRFIRRERTQAGDIHSGLMRITRSEALDKVIRVLKNGARTCNEISTCLQTDPPSDEKTLAGFLNDIIALQMLVPTITPTVYGDDTLSALMDEIAREDRTCDVLKVLDQVAEHIEAANRSDRLTFEVLNAIEMVLQQNDVALTKSALHVDAYLPETQKITLDRSFLSQIQNQIESLGPILTQENQPLARFKQRFEKRYGSSFVPLLDVLDDDVGLGFSDTAKGVSPLAKGLGDPVSAPAPASWDRWQTFIANRMADISRTGETEIRLSDEDLAHFKTGSERFPSSFAILGTLHTAVDDDLYADKTLFEFKYASSPDCAALMGRFCNGHDGLLDKMRRFCRDEQDVIGEDVVYADIVHVPEGRVGNVIQRPRLRDWEICYFGSSTDQSHRIDIKDLQLGLHDGVLILWCERLRKRILPRLSNAHNYTAPANLPVYRFLALLQGDGDRAIRFGWGGLSVLRSLPRVRYKNIILTRASWTLEHDEIRRISTPETPQERSAAIRHVFAHRGIPDRVELVQGDNVMEFDMRAPAHAHIFVEDIKKLRTVKLQETAQALVDDSTNAPAALEPLVNEIVLLGRAGAPASAIAKPSPDIQSQPARISAFSPGGEWLYAKIYTGPATADRIISGPLLDLMEKAVELGCRSAFFIRYRDPDHHIRIRINGAPDILWGPVLKALTRAMAPLIDEHFISQFVFDTYVPEWRRYGGALGLLEAEALFTADSLLIARALRDGVFAKAGGSDERWKLAVMANYALCQVFDSVEASSGMQAIDRAADAMLAEFSFDKPRRKALNLKFRENRGFISSVFNQDTDNAIVAANTAALARYSAQLAEPAKKLASFFGPERLQALVQSYVHMTNNRIFQDTARLQEMVVYDMLRKGFKEQKARQKYQC